MDYYIVRIYRQEKDKPHKLVGVVEEVTGGAGEKDIRAFTSLEELWKILNFGKGGKDRRSESGRKRQKKAPA